MFERQSLAASPGRRATVEHTHAAGDVVVVEGRWVEGPPFCMVLTLEDGLIVSDRGYVVRLQLPSQG